jgi:hypothetical protein
LADLLTIEPATEADALEVAELIREEDALEIARWSGRTPLEAVCAAMRVSIAAWSVRCNGRLLAVAGVAPGAQRHIGAPWALTTRHAPAHPKAFWQASRYLMDRIGELFRVNVVFVDYTKHRAHRWLERLGFILRGPVPAGRDGALFCPAWRLPCVNPSPSA